MTEDVSSSSADDSLLRLALSVGANGDEPAVHPQTEGHSRGNGGTEASSGEKHADLFSQKAQAMAAEPQSVDSLIASQMTKLSVDDREKAYLDVHGVSDFVTETPELVQQSLLDLQKEIDLLRDKRAYKMAEKLDPNFCRDREFRLAFLRSDKFDAPKAALRIIRHFQMKLDLFGMDKLVLQVTQDDLDADAMDALNSCTGRYLNKFDSGGRMINLMITSTHPLKTDPTLRKAFYQANMAAFSDVKVHRNGIVSVFFQNPGKLGTSGNNAELSWKLPKISRASPVPVPAIHMCYINEAWRWHHAIARTALSIAQLVRVRLHHGTVSQCLEELQDHGIDPASIPINESGEITDLKEWRQKMEEQRRYERLNFPLRSTFYVPFCEDVLLGTGAPVQNHSGNKRLRVLVADHIKHYETAQRGGKTAIALGIIDIIRQRGGFFLKKQDGGEWSRVNDEVATLKVTAAFRTLRQKLKLYDD